MAKHLRKVKEGLAIRQAKHNEAIARLTPTQASAYRKPGSMNSRKSYKGKKNR